MTTKTYYKKISINGSPERVYSFFTQEGKWALITDSETILPSSVGAEFSLFGGAITGVISELEFGKRIVWDNYFCYVRGWDENAFTRVIMTFKPIELGTEVYLEHSGIPKDAYVHVKDGWEEQVIDPLVRFFKKGNK